MTPIDMVLIALPGTCRDIRRRSRLCRTTIRSILLKLRAEGEIHISEWGPDGQTGRIAAVYTPGKGEDAQDPRPPKTKPTLEASYPFHARRDPLVAALFGHRN